MLFFHIFEFCNVLSFFHYLWLKIYYQISHIMELRISELARQRGMTIADIAKEIGISRVNLSNSLNGNPTLSRLREVAKVLNVEVSELFKPANMPQVSGYLEYRGVITKIESLDALKELINKIDSENIQPK